MKAIALIALIILGASIGGCHFHTGGHYPGPVHHGGAVVVSAGHVHDAHCGHYRYRGDWYHASGHVHRDGCGHVHRGGYWTRGY